MADTVHGAGEGLGDVATFLDGIADARRRAEAQVLVPLHERATGQPAVMWGGGSRRVRPVPLPVRVGP